MKIAVIFTLIAILYGLKDGAMMGFIFGVALLYILIFGLLIHFDANQMTVQLKGTQGEDERSRIHAHVLLKNRGFLPVFAVQLTIGAENMITGVKDNYRMQTSVGPKGTKELDLEIQDTLCGGIRMYCNHATLSDFLGLIKKEISVEAEEFAYILPAFRELPVSKIDISKYDMESHKFSPYKKGNDSSETFGINQYQPGDSIKFIHWKLSGKMDELMIRELGLPIENKLMILIDKSLMNQPELEGIKRSEATELAVSLSYTFAKTGIHHKVGWFNQRRKEFECVEVNEEADLWTLMPMLLTSPYSPEIDPVPVKFIEADIEKDFSHFIVVANGELDIERLMFYGEVNIYRPEDFKKS